MSDKTEASVMRQLMADANRARIAAAVIAGCRTSITSKDLAEFTNRYLAALGLDKPREPEMFTIHIGEGRYGIAASSFGGEVGISFERLPEPHVIGTVTGKAGDPVGDERLRIAISDARAAQVLIDSATWVRDHLSPPGDVLEIPDGAPEVVEPGHGRVHNLKIWPQHFDEILGGEKMYELRRDDRKPRFQPGDTLRLREWSPESERYLARETWVRVLVVRRRFPGMKDGYALLSIRPCSEPEAACVGGVGPVEEWDIDESLAERDLASARSELGTLRADKKTLSAQFLAAQERVGVLLRCLTEVARVLRNRGGAAAIGRDLLLAEVNVVLAAEVPESKEKS